MDGVVEWEELIRVLEPQLAKLWRAQLEVYKLIELETIDPLRVPAHRKVAPEWDRWVEFHWETVGAVFFTMIYYETDRFKTASYGIENVRGLHKERRAFLG